MEKLTVRFANGYDIPQLLELNNVPDPAQMKKGRDTTIGLCKRTEENFQNLINEQSLIVIEYKNQLVAMQGFELFDKSSENHTLVIALVSRLTVTNNGDNIAKLLGDAIILNSYSKEKTLFAIVLRTNEFQSVVAKIVRSGGFLEPVYNLLRQILMKASVTMCIDVLSLRSQFFHSLRHFSSHPKLRSTTHRLGIILKV